MATLRDWLATCQAIVPRFCGKGECESEGSRGSGGERAKTYTEAGGQHAGCDDQVGQHKAGHAEGEEDRLAGVRVKCRVDDFLGLPELGGHGWYLPLLVCDQELLGLLEAGATDEEGPGRRGRRLAPVLDPNPVSKPQLMLNQPPTVRLHRDGVSSTRARSRRPCHPYHSH